MAVKRISPHNLPGILKHFENQRKDAKKKLQDLNRRRIKLEADIALFDDGIAWCEKVYLSTKPKVT